MAFFTEVFPRDQPNNQTHDKQKKINVLKKEQHNTGKTQLRLSQETHGHHKNKSSVEININISLLVN